jgi:hypothetical protein
MRTETISLGARLNDTDRRLITLACQSHAFERAAAQKEPAPIAYGARNRRLAYTGRLGELERRLRMLATEAERWRVRLDTDLDPIPVLPLYRKAGIVPPTVIRNLAMRNQFYLVRVTGQFSAAGNMRIASLRYALRLSGVGQTAARQPAVHAFFPRVGARRYGGTEVLVGLRSTLEFWVAVTPGGSLIGTADKIPANVRADLVYGPVKYQFGKTRVVGAGARRPSVEWSYAGEGVAGGTEFENLMVLRVPKGLSSCRVEEAIEVDVTIPTLLQPLLGERRLLRDRRHWCMRLG